MQENLKNESESSTNTKEIFQKKRIRRVMVNGVLVDRKRKREDDKTDMGEDCQCKRYKCFEVTNSEERRRVFTLFRKLGSHELQDLHLSELITVEKIKQRRRSKAIESEENGKKSAEHSASFFYKLKIPNEGQQQRGHKELNVCRMAFLNILGISRSRLRATQKMLYKQRYQKSVLDPTEDLYVPEQLETLIMSQIDEYALSETYSVYKMHKHFLSRFRINVPYNIYWLVFHAKWNIAKYQPPPYTCPTFDTFHETLNMFGLVDFSKDTR